MKSVYRWVAQHGGLCRTILIFALIGLTVYSAQFEYVSFLSVYLMDLIIWLIASRFIAMAPVKLAREPHDWLTRDCDPYPLLAEMEQQLSWKLSGNMHQAVQMDYAACLRETGQYQKSAEILESINIDKFPGTTPNIKYIYYHNLTDILFLLGRNAEAKIWYKKSEQIYQDIPQGKPRQLLTHTHDLMEAEILHREGNHEDAVRKITWIKWPDQRKLLDAAFLAAKCHIALEEPEKAREKLQFVIDKGNKLYVVEEAKALLEALN